jgi:hypothetical protein
MLGFWAVRKVSDECNAPMESFFHTLKTERVHHRVYATRAEARRDLFHYVEGFYNPRPPALGAGLYQPSSSRENGGLTPSTFSGEDHSYARTRSSKGGASHGSAASGRSARLWARL